MRSKTTNPRESWPLWRYNEWVMAAITEYKKIWLSPYLVDSANEWFDEVWVRRDEMLKAYPVAATGHDAQGNILPSMEVLVP